MLKQLDLILDFNIAICYPKEECCNGKTDQFDCPTLDIDELNLDTAIVTLLTGNNIKQNSQALAALNSSKATICTHLVLDILPLPGALILLCIDTYGVFEVRNPKDPASRRAGYRFNSGSS